jgi:hypothetical protein
MQEIIVYRNPLEAAMWSSFMSGDFFPVMVGIAVFFAVFLVSNAVCVKIWGQWGDAAKRGSYVSLALGAAAALATIWKMAL